MLDLGEGPNQASYYATDEGLFSLTGPIVDQKGRLLFFPTAGYDRYRSLLVFENGKVYRQSLFEIMKKWRGASQLLFVSQQGYIQLNNVFISLSQNGDTLYPQMTTKIPVTDEARYYPMPFGAIMESVRPKFSFSIELDKKGEIKVRNLEETRSWDTMKANGFSIGNDGWLYRESFLYSAIKPDKLNFDHYYIGRLISGHAVWASGGIKGSDRYFTVTNMAGNVEAVLELPWAPVPGSGPQFFNYGLGPWGELYCLLPPSNRPETKMEKIFDPDPSKPAELVVVRNHLKYFGRLNDGGVRLRKEPNTTSDILGTYPVKTGFRILEKRTKEETIGGQKNVWYKVRLLDGKEGWFFGAFVQNLYDGPNSQPPPWPNVPDW